jgi:hypothetical protein
VQFGVGASGGASIAGLTAQVEFEKYSENVILSSDATAAFQSLDLRAAMTELFSYPHFATTWRWLYWVHADPKSVVFAKQSPGLEIIEFGRGGHQGDPLYPFFFALALHKAYVRSVENSATPLTPVAYLDDFSIIGEFPAASAAMDKFQALASDLGLTLNEKSNVLAHTEDSLNKRLAIEYAQLKGWSFSDLSIVILGMRVGNRNCQDVQWIEREVRSSEPIFEFLKRDRLTKQIRFLLLRNVVVAKLSFLMRTSPPDAIMESLEWFDRKTLETFCSIFEIDTASLTAEIIAQIGLPLSKAGFGLHPTRDLADAAFVSSIWPVIGRAGPPSHGHDLASQFHDARERLASKGVLLPDDDPSSVKKLQKTLSDQLHARIFRELMAASPPAAKSRLLSASQPHSSYCLSHAPCSPSFRLSDDEFLTFGLMRLGLHGTIGPHQHSCGACGQPLPEGQEERITHAMACTKTRKREGYFRHHHIEHELRRTLLESSAFHVTNEPHFESKGQNLRPDLEAFFGGGRPSSLVEVSVTHPSCQSYIKLNSHLIPRAAVRQREKEKSAKYKELVNGRRNFTPAIAETYGALGEQLEKFVQFHSSIISRKTGAPYNRVVSNHFSAIAFALQRGNAQIIHRSLFHALP